MIKIDQKLPLTTLDDKDRLILNTLQQQGRIPISQLAEQVALSATPCHERVKKLEREGFIKGYRAILDPNKVGAGLLIYVEISLNKSIPNAFDTFRKKVLALSEIEECHLVSGEYDYLLKTRVANMPQYRSLLGTTLLSLPYVSGSRTLVVMEEVKNSY